MGQSAERTLLEREWGVSSCSASSTGGPSHSSCRQSKHSQPLVHTEIHLKGARWMTSGCKIKQGKKLPRSGRVPRFRAAPRLTVDAILYLELGPSSKRRPVSHQAWLVCGALELRLPLLEARYKCPLYPAGPRFPDALEEVTRFCAKYLKSLPPPAAAVPRPVNAGYWLPPSGPGQRPAFSCSAPHLGLL